MPASGSPRTNGCESLIPPASAGGHGALSKLLQIDWSGLRDLGACDHRNRRHRSRRKEPFGWWSTGTSPFATASSEHRSKGTDIASSLDQAQQSVVLSTPTRSVAAQPVANSLARPSRKRYARVDAALSSEMSDSSSDGEKPPVRRSSRSSHRSTVSRAGRRASF